MAKMTLKEIISNIRKAVWARDVRESIAQGMEYLDEINFENNSAIDFNKKIDKRTLRIKEKIQFTDSDNLTPDLVYEEHYGGSYLHFTAKERPCNFECILIKNSSSNNICYVYGFDADKKKTQIGSVDPNSSKMIDVSSASTYQIFVQGQGPYNADISKFEFTEYIDVFGVVDAEIEKYAECVNNAVLIKPTASGTEMVLNDSSDMPIQELHLSGKSEQIVTTGAQLFDVNNKLHWNSVFSVDSEGWISAIIPANAGTTDRYYTFNTPKSDLLKPSTTYLAVMEFGMTLLDKLNVVAISPDVSVGNKSQFKGYTSFANQSVIPNDTNDSFENSDCMCNGYIQAKPGFAGGQVKFRFSLIADASMTIDKFKYEPYTGGMASPSPNYKQNIESTDNSTIKLAGKNLFDKFCDNKHVERFGITFDWNTDDNSIRIKGTSTGNAQYVLVSLDESEKKFNNSTIGSNYAFKMFGLPKSCFLNVSYGQKAYGEDLSIMPNISKYVGRRWVAICVPKGVTVDAIVYPMLVLGDTINEYEPYKQIQTVTFNHILNGIDDVRDELIVRADGTGQLIQRIKLYNCSQISRNLGVDPNNKYYYLASIDKNSTHASKVVSSHFTSKTFNEKWGNVFKVNGSFYFGKQEAPDNISDTNSMKQWLIDNKVKILFQLEEPVVTDLTAEEVQKILALHTNKPNTTIWNDQDAEMQITYVADAKNYIDNKLAEIQALTLEGGN